MHNNWHVLVFQYSFLQILQEVFSPTEHVAPVFRHLEVLYDLSEQLISGQTSLGFQTLFNQGFDGLKELEREGFEVVPMFLLVDASIFTPMYLRPTDRK